MAEAYANTGKPEENMDPAEEVLAFFQQFLAGEEPIKSSLTNNTDFYVEASKNLVFSLPALHELINKNKEISYFEFRQSLFRSRLNEQLKGLGGRVELHDSTGKVDTNLYRLVRI